MKLIIDCIIEQKKKSNLNGLYGVVVSHWNEKVY